MEFPLSSSPAFPQNDTRMVPASDRLYQAVVQSG